MMCRDDHDYGWNDGDVNNPVKHEARDMFLDFVDEPAHSPRRLQFMHTSSLYHYILCILSVCECVGSVVVYTLTICLVLQAK